MGLSVSMLTKGSSAAARGEVVGINEAGSPESEDDDEDKEEEEIFSSSQILRERDNFSQEMTNLTRDDFVSSTAGALLSYLPEFENLPSINNPKVLRFTDHEFEGKWLLFLTCGSDPSDSSKSLLEIWQHIEKFQALQCLVFVLSTDSWINLRRFRKRKVLEGGLGGRLDINLLALQKTPQNQADLSSLGILNEQAEDAPNGWKYCYPSYLLYGPDRRLAEKAVLREEGSNAVTCPLLAGSIIKEVRLFQWPLTDSIVHRLLWTIEEWAPIYEIVSCCGVTTGQFVELVNSRLKNPALKIENKLLQFVFDEVFHSIHTK